MAGWSHVTILTIAIAMMALVAALDVETGTELSVSIFYLLPVGISAWFTRGSLAGGVAVASAALWLAADRLAGVAYAHPLIPLWNALVRLGFFLIVGSLLLALRRALRRQQELARRDPLTGLANLRHFMAVAEEEVYRAGRYDHPISIAYLDLDDFKDVNDQYGHHRGDQVLRTVATTIAGNVRVSDTVGRLGGDEFALLMPETGGDAATAVIEKLQAALRSELAVAGHGVTVSVGCVTFSQPPASVQEVIGQADRLMYEAKRAGKDTLAHAVR